MKGAMRLALVGSVAITLLVGSGTTSLAECTGQPNRFPRYSDVAPTADTVVIGTVIDSKGEDPTEATVLFSLRVDHIVRGDPPATMDIEGLQSGLPVHGAKGCRENAFLYVHVGDVIALALDGKLDQRTGVNAAAWIEGRPDRQLVPGVRVMTRADVIAAAEAMPPTDAAPTGSQLDPADLVSAVLRGLAEALGELVAGGERR